MTPSTSRTWLPILGEEGCNICAARCAAGPSPKPSRWSGLLCKLDPQAVQVFLPARMKDFPRTSQDRVVRQISASGAPGRCRILLELLDHLDPLVMPLAIDEIGVTADREALGRLLTIVDGDLPPGAGQLPSRQSRGSAGTHPCAGIRRCAEAHCRGQEILWLATAAGTAHRRVAGAGKIGSRVGACISAQQRARQGGPDAGSAGYGAPTANLYASDGTRVCG